VKAYRRTEGGRWRDEPDVYRDILDAAGRSLLR